MNKGISTLQESSDMIYLFDGFMDFLSAKVYFQERTFFSIILNSAAHIDKRIAKVVELKEQLLNKTEITCFFDNNTTGRIITKKAYDHLAAFDGSYLYKAVDFNDFYKAVQKDDLKLEIKRRRHGRRL